MCCVECAQWVANTIGVLRVQLGYLGWRAASHTCVHFGAVGRTLLYRRGRSDDP
jgi:hypothetical protein